MSVIVVAASSDRASLSRGDPIIVGQASGPFLSMEAQRRCSGRGRDLSIGVTGFFVNEVSIYFLQDLEFRLIFTSSI